MNVQFRVTRRSGDKVYILSEITGYDKSLSVVLSATTDAGARIPCYSFPYCNMSDPGEVAQVVSDAASASRQLGYSGHSRNTAQVRFFVIVLPWLEIRRWILEFRGLDEQGQVVCECSKRIDVGSATWGDRLSDLTDSERGDAIELLDAAFIHDRIDVSFVSAIEDQGRVVVHALVDMPMHPDARLELSFLDAQGQPVDLEHRVISDSIDTAEGEGEGRRRLEVAFETDRANPGVCVTAQDTSGVAAPGFAMVGIRGLIELVGSTIAGMASAEDDPGYDRWFKQRHRVDLPTLLKQAATKLYHRASFSFVVVYEGNPSHHVYDLVWSFLSQSYGRWELIVVSRGPAPSSLGDVVDSVHDDRIFIVETSPDASLSECLERGIEAAEGECVGFMQISDKLAPDALFRFAMAVEEDPEADLLYCDSDTFDAADVHSEPVLRPCFSPELLRSTPYVDDLVIVRTQLLNEIGLLLDLSPLALRYDLVLRASEQARSVVHVPRVLCHRRFATQDLALDASGDSEGEECRRVLVAHCQRVGISAEVMALPQPRCYRVRHVLKDTPLVSVIVPTQDNPERLERCLMSLVQHVHYRNYEVVVLDGGSQDERTWETYDKLAARVPGLRVATIDDASNRSRFLNQALAHARGGYLLFVHDDVRFDSDDPIEGLLGFFQTPDVVAAGPKRLYADGSIEHEGLFVGGSRVCTPVLAGAPSTWEGYRNRGVVSQNVTALCTDCFLVRRADFEAVGGFSEKLDRFYGGVDLFLKLADHGGRAVFTPHVVVSHCRETGCPPSYDRDADAALASETYLIKHRWSGRFDGQGDPHANANLDPDNPFYALLWDVDA